MMRVLTGIVGNTTETAIHITVWQHTVNFFDSSFFLALTTLVIGFVALIVYRKQKIDKKKDAANIILLEIKDAEKHLLQAKETIIKQEFLPEAIFAMRASNWEKYSYLFVRDFTDEEWDLVNTFYEKCKLYDEALQYDNSFYRNNVEQARVNLHKVLSEYTKTYIEELRIASKIMGDKEKKDAIQEADDKYHALLNEFGDKFMTEVWGTDPYAYTPDKPFRDGRTIISTIKLDLSTSTIGIKLERIINQNFRTRLTERILGTRGRI